MEIFPKPMLFVLLLIKIDRLSLISELSLSMSSLRISRIYPQQETNLLFADVGVSDVMVY